MVSSERPGEEKLAKHHVKIEKITIKKKGDTFT